MPPDVYQTRRVRGRFQILVATPADQGAGVHTSHTHARHLERPTMGSGRAGYSDDAVSGQDPSTFTKTVYSSRAWSASWRAGSLAWPRSSKKKT